MRHRMVSRDETQVLPLPDFSIQEVEKLCQITIEPQVCILDFDGIGPVLVPGVVWRRKADGQKIRDGILAHVLRQYS